MEKNFPKNSKHKNIKIYDNDITKNIFNKNFYEKRKYIKLIVLLALNINIYLLKDKKFINSLTLSNFDLNFNMNFLKLKSLQIKLEIYQGGY